VHVGSFNSKEAIELVKHATEIKADGISSLPPTFYYSYSDKIKEHKRATQSDDEN
jgi:dihydrodipicolinate synthase/N-acetylneuraminate lyase